MNNIACMQDKAYRRLLVLRMAEELHRGVGAGDARARQRGAQLRIRDRSVIGGTGEFQTRSSYHLGRRRLQRWLD